MESPCQHFDEMPQQDVMSWTAMILGYDQHGCYKEALRLFLHMGKGTVKPNHFTCASSTSSCASLCNLNMSQQIHNHIVTSGFKNAKPNEFTFSNALGAGGTLEMMDYGKQLHDHIIECGYEAHALLGASRIHGNVELGKLVTQHLIYLDPYSSSTYVLLSNMYVAANM